MKSITLIFIVLMASAGLIAQTAIAPAVGDGTLNNPYEIASLENLYWIAAGDDVVPTPDQATRWSSRYIQTADIDASATEDWFDGAGWKPIGIWFASGHPNNLPFVGSYDGQGNIIDAVYINRPSGQHNEHIGLFGRVSNATIKNLGVTNVNIVGMMNVGGLIGWQEQSLVNNCYSTGSVSGEGFIGAYVGGLVGRQNGTAIISESFSTVNVSGFFNVGGLLGIQDDSSYINDSYSTGSVTGILYHIGGLVGLQEGSSINSCYSTGNVSGTDFVGGLVGIQDDSTISNSYSKGSVNGDDYVGGLVGLQDYSIINKCYSTGNVTGRDFVGGLVGFQWNPTTYYSFWNTETSGQSTSAGGEGRTTAEMTYPYAANTYVNWDFADIWAADVDYDMNNGYPYLTDVTLSVEDDIIEVIERLTINNYPNPFNPETTIKFYLPQDAERLSLKIYNIRGQLVRTLIVNTPHPKGEYQIVWDGKNDLGQPVTSGVYFYRMITPVYDQVNKMLLLK